MVGAVMGVTGAGGSVLSIPILVFALNLSVVEAAPIGLFTVMVSAIIAAVLGLAKGLVRYKAAALLAIFGLFLAPVGVWVAHRLPDNILAVLFVLVMLFLGVRSLFSDSQSSYLNNEVFGDKRAACTLNPKTSKLYWTRHCAHRLAITGAMAGFVSGLLGLGGGFVIVPALYKVSNLESKMVVATSLAVVAVISGVSMITYAVQSPIEWRVAFPFAGGALMGMLAGHLAAGRVSRKTSQRIFGFLTLLIAMVFACKLIAEFVQLFI